MKASRLLLLGLACLVLSCGGPAKVDSTELRVVCTTGMITSLAERIAGEEASVKGLMGAGVDPHLYKASAGDLTLLRKAKLVLYNGLHLEARFGDVLSRLKHARSVAVAEGLEGVELHYPDDSGGHPDPHLWFDVSAWSKVALRIGEELAMLDPDHADLYHERSTKLAYSLLELDVEVVRILSPVPEERRLLVTAHDAFHYFGRRYGFEVRGLQGISTVSEPGAADLRAVSELIVSRRVPAIFVESSVPRRTLEAVREAVQARGHEVRIGEELFSDAPGSPDTPEGSYEGMVLHNVRSIARGLGGN